MIHMRPRSGVWVSPQAAVGLYRLLLFIGSVSSVLLAFNDTNTEGQWMDHQPLWSSPWSITDVKDRSQRLNRTERTAFFHSQPMKGFYYPISSYHLKHHKPTGYDPWGKKKPEMWEYKGQYFYGGYNKKSKKSGIGAVTLGLVAAGLPLILAPLLGMLMTVPVLIPINGGFGGTGITDGSGGTIITTAGRRRRSLGKNYVPDIEQTLRLREMQLVSDYLQEVRYDEGRQSRLVAEYLSCQGMLRGDGERCLERLACQFSRRQKGREQPAAPKKSHLERTVTSILLGHLLRNDFVPASFKHRLRLAARSGRKANKTCFQRFPCSAIDGAKMQDGRQGRGHASIRKKVYA